MDRSLVQARQSQSRRDAAYVIAPEQAKTTAPQLCAGSVRLKTPDGNRGIPGHGAAPARGSIARCPLGTVRRCRSARRPEATGLRSDRQSAPDRTTTDAHDSKEFPW